jgi:hypothetical protein
MFLRDKSYIIAALLALFLFVGLASAGARADKPAAKADPAAEKTYPPMVAVHGGPDGGGYYFIDSDDEAMNAPRYEWIDISTIGTPVDLSNGTLPEDDMYSNPIDMGMDFVFYGTTVTSVAVSSNGFLSFDALTSASFSNSAIPTAATPNNLVAVEWDDMAWTAGTGACYSYYDEANRRFIVSWENWEYYSSPYNPHNFQVIINSSDNSIVMQYGPNDAGFHPTSTVGIENASGSIGTQYLFNQAGLHSEMAIYFGLQGPIFGTNNVGPTSILSPGAYGQVGIPITPSVFIEMSVQLQRHSRRA